MVWYSQLFKNFPQFVVIHTTNLGWALNPGTVLIREGRGKIETQRGRSCEDRGGDWSSWSTNQGAPRIARNLEKPREKHGADSSPVDSKSQLNTFSQPLKFYLWGKGLDSLHCPGPST